MIIPDASGPLALFGAIRAEAERRRRQRALRGLLTELDADDGPFTEQDRADIERYQSILEG